MKSNLKGAVVWIAKILAAFILLQTLFFKFTAADESVYIFSSIGIEPWGRIATGIFELVASICILLPATTIYGSMLAAALMGGAIFFHLTKLGISVKDDGGQLFIYAVIVLICSIFLLIVYKKQLSSFLRRITPGRVNVKNSMGM